MSECVFCRAAKGEIPADVVYEDERIFAFLDQNPVGAGHIIVMPKEHFPILEQIPDDIVGELFSVANRLSTAVFETLGAHGTNLLLMNGPAAGQKAPHAMLNLIPRFNGDGLDFSWKTKKLSEEEMSTVELQIKEHQPVIGLAEEKKGPVAQPQEPDQVGEGEGEENYLIRQIRRIP
ncbi:HIT family protein [Candidatus Woesearchaeota archaeon]|nr:HIT family protein [Candidatus Woesearchaeota archaeon]